MWFTRSLRGWARLRRFSTLNSALIRRPEHKTPPALELLESRLAPATLLGVTNANVLVRFDSAAPGSILSSTPITGLVGGDTVIGLDFRPATGQLYALGSGSRIYTISPNTAVATQVGADGAFALTGAEFGFDFNPVPDRIRVTSDLDQNLRLNPNNGALAAADLPLAYAAGDTNVGDNPNVVASAYTNSFGGATSTTLFDIDSSNDVLVTQNPPNNGTLNTVGALGVNVLDVGGFDIQALPAGGNAAFAALTTNGTASGLYTINLTTGAATLVGNIGASPTLVRDLAVVPELTPSGTAYAIDSATNNLVRFNTANPSTIISSIPVTGLIGGDTIIGLDFRPATGELFALGSGSRVYVINPTTGAATQRGSDGQFSLAAGQAFGFDFNPVVDRIRLISDAEQNFRVNPNDGAQVDGDAIVPGVQPDTDLAYAIGDPNFGQNPDSGGAAYTNSFSGATTTTLFDIDTAQNVLVRQGGLDVPPGTPSPNGGQLFTVGPLGINPTDDLTRANTSFDIQTLPDGTNFAFAVLTTDGTTSALYSINLITGAATQVGAVPIGGAATPLLVRAMTLAPAGTFEFSAPTYSVGESGPVATITVNRLRGSEGVVTVRVDTTNGSATAGPDFTDTDRVIVFGAGETSQTLQIPIVNDDFDEPDETINLTLSSPTGGAGLGAQSTAVLTITDDDPLQNANVFGVTTTNNLIRFNSASPGTVTSATPITGLVGGDTVLGIDFRPATGQLYALGSGSRLYTIDVSTGAATQVGASGAFTLTGTEFGFDFNPVPDRIRLTSDANQNLRLDPNSGALTAADTALAYAAADVNAGQDPNVVGSAYTNSINGSTTTTLFGIDTTLDILVTQNPPNNGTLNTVGSLGVNATDVLGFDIRGATNTGLASLVVGGTPGLYLIDLATGAATLVGLIGATLTVRGLAIAPEGYGSTTLVGSTATFNGGSAADTISFDQAGGLLRHNRFSAGDPGFNSDFDFDPSTAGDQTLSATNAAVTIVVNSGASDDLVVIGSATAPASGLATTFQVNGQGGGDSLRIEDGADATGRTITIDGATSTVTGLGGPVTYASLESVTVNAGGGADTINVLGTAAAATNINAGGGSDTVVFGADATLSGGFLDGGAGSNTLDYSAYTTAVTVDLSAAQAGTLFLATLSGAQEPGPLSSSTASGTGVFTLNAAQTALTFAISYQGLQGSPISGTHFHNAAMGVNGAIVRGLTAAETNGLVTPAGSFLGVWSSTDAAGIGGVGSSGPLTPALVAELLANRIYFNLHTQPSFPSGEIRGQLIAQGTVSPATGTAGVRGFANVTGGAGADLLTGDAAANILRGGAGNDVLVGGPGADQFFGDGDADLLIWNNGDGSDVMEGGAGADTVQVNGSTGATGDVFTVSAGSGGRVNFQRTNLVPFSLDIGSTEALTVNGQDGDDSATIGDLSTAAGLTAISFSGGAGADTATVNFTGTTNSIPSGLTVDGGGGFDALRIQGGAFTTTHYRHTNGSDGFVDLTLGGTTSTITFTGLSPLTNTGTAVDAIFTLPNGGNLALLEDDGTGGNNLIQLRSANSPPSFETTTFTSPTGSLTINLGGGDDVLTVDPALTEFAAALTVTGQAGTDIVNLNAPLTLSAGTGNLTVVSETVNVNNSVTTTGTTGAVLLEVSGELRTAAAGDINAAGSVTFRRSGTTAQAFLAGDITTSNDPIEFDALPVNLLGNVTLNAGTGAITFDDRVDGGFALTLTTTGVTTFSGPVGGGTALTSLTTNAGGSTSINGGVRTTGNQTYADEVTITGTAGNTLTGADLAFTGGITATGGGPLTLTSSGALSVTTGAVALNGSALTVANTGAGTIATVISGTGSTLTKTGAGTLTLGADNTYTGTTTVTAGTLLINGSQANSAVAVTGTLGGVGTAGAVTVNTGGTLSPGPVGGAGVLRSGAASLAAGATFAVQLNGSGAGQSGQLDVTGTVNLGGDPSGANGATLTVTPGFTAPTGTTFVIVNNDGTDAVIGKFNGLAEGAVLTAGGQQFSITYVGGTGNDVALTRLANPVTATTTTLNTSANPATFGSPITFTATVRATTGVGTPTGTVVFLDSQSPSPIGTAQLNASGQAQFVISNLSQGSHQITAQYQGDVNFAASTSAPVTQLVTAARSTPTLSLTSTPNPSGVGQPVTFTVSIAVAAGSSASTPTGTVTFLVDGVSQGTAPVTAAGSGRGSAVFTVSGLSAGTRQITAQYSGDANTSPGTAGPISQIVSGTPAPTGATPDQVFVSQIFLDLLGRDATAADQIHFGALLAQGATHVQIVQIIEGSLEYRLRVVELAFQSLLGRPADAPSKASFADALGAGATQEQLETVILGSDEYFVSQGGGTASGFIQAVYQDVLLRSAGPGEVESWLRVLAAGASRQDVAAAILTSAEGDTVTVQLVYQQLLRRSADAGGVAHFVGALQQGATKELLIAAIAGSAEYDLRVNGALYQQYTVSLFQDLLGRPANSAEQTFVAASLSSGARPFQVVLVVTSSLEYQSRVVNQQYLDFLKRPADASGLQAFVSVLQRGGTVEQVQSALTASDEYFVTQGGGAISGFLDALYRDALGRPIDSPSQAALTQGLAGGLSRAAVTAGVFASDEYRSILVQDNYQLLLGRLASSSEVAAWLAVLRQGARDEQLIATLAGSDEYFAGLS